MARTPHLRLWAALARQAERTAAVADTVRAGGVLDDVRRLADLLEVCGQPALRETLHVPIRYTPGRCERLA